MARASSRFLSDHDEIRGWAEERGATPARVKGTGGRGDPGMIRLDFPGFSGEGKLEPIPWEEWFRSFDENGLALAVQDRTARGERSNFNKLVARETAEGRQRSRRASGASSAGRRGTRQETGRGGARTTGARKSTGRKSTARKSAVRKRAGAAKTTARTVRARKGSAAHAGARKGSRER